MLWQGHLAQRASPAARASRLRLGSLASPAPRLVPPHGPALRCSTGKSLTLPTASSKILGVRHFSGTRRDVDLAPATLRRLGTLALGVSALGMLLGVVYCLEVEPLSSRRRVMIFSEKWDFNRGVEREAYLLRTRGGERCAANDSRSRNILEVASNLLAVGKLQKLRNWRVYVIDDRKSKDVEVLANGAIFVYTGVLPLAGNDDGLASVLGQAIAESILRHFPERISHAALYYSAAGLVSSALRLRGLAAWVPVLLPACFMLRDARNLQDEADAFALLLIASAGYDPRARFRVLLQHERAYPTPHVPDLLGISTEPALLRRQRRAASWVQTTDAATIVERMTMLEEWVTQTGK